MKDYYNAEDVVAITGSSMSHAYELIRRLIKSFQKEYPNAITIKCKIPIWYFEKSMMNKKEEQNEKEI